MPPVADRNHAIGSLGVQDSKARKPTENTSDQEVDQKVARVMKRLLATPPSPRPARKKPAPKR